MGFGVFIKKLGHSIPVLNYQYEKILLNMNIQRMDIEFIVYETNKNGKIKLKQFLKNLVI